MFTQSQLRLSPASFLYLNGISKRPGGGAGLDRQAIKTSICHECEIRGAGLVEVECRSKKEAEWVELHHENPSMIFLSKLI